MRPSPNVRHRGGDRRLARLGRLLPRAGAHPVVDEVAGGGGLVSRVEGGDRSGDGAADSVGVVRGGLVRLDEREQRRLVERHRAHAPRVRERRDQRYRGAVGMTHQRERRPGGMARRRGGAGSGEHRLDERNLVVQADDPVRRPVRTLARVVRVGREDAELRREQLQQPAPLRRAAGVRMQADDARAGPGLAKERLGRSQIAQKDFQLGLRKISGSAAAYRPGGDSGGIPRRTARPGRAPRTRCR